ncbi:MAG: MBL fold metallo-hydrolase [Halothermotrichaceae bacterium]
MKLKVSVLASGSSGNSIYVSTENSSILVDAGLSGKKIEERMQKVNGCCQALDALLVTHEHIDHIKGVGVLSRRYDLPIYANDLTWAGAEKRLGKIKEKNCRIFKKEFMVGDLGVTPFSISHDASDPVGYIINCGSKKIGIATDMGYITPDVKEMLKGLDLLVLESNHDLEMLMTGSYPWSLKNRINGEEGHLSNDAAAEILPELINSNFPSILLAHLSKDNNKPELAYITVKNNLEDKDFVIGEDLQLEYTYRHKPTKLYEVGG